MHFKVFNNSNLIFQIKTGMQHTVLYAAEPRGLPLTEKILPQYLKELGYAVKVKKI